MYCWKCGKQLPEGAKYCSKCGVSVEKTSVSVGANVKQVITDKGSSFDVPAFLRRLKVCALIAVSLLLIWTNWIVTYGESSYDFSRYKGDIATITEDVEDMAGWAGADIDLSTARKIGLCIIDGRLSPRELFVIGKSMAPVLNSVQETLESWGETDEGITWMQVLIYVYSVLFWACVLVGVVSIFLTLIGSGMHSEKLYMTLVIVLFCVCAMLCIWSVEEVELQIRPTVTSIVSLAASCIATAQRTKNDRLAWENADEE